ncbi:GlxA family transcriptional regulator [Roseovarius nitratireducens]|uniref:GlxA family transcriptional regulator n=1 Tax=Roseovarius nitratireducens TaxID=2044597 RepID=UPI001F0C5CC0|nr:helix-turn-helix domain-containing protein [Roseovarius nitratireducens]
MNMSLRTSHKHRHVDIIVADGFVLSELASIADTLRIANRVIARQFFSWTFHSSRGGVIMSPSGISVETDPVPERPAADIVFMIGNVDPEYGGVSLGPIVSRYRYAGALVHLLAESATRYIRERGERDAHTTHWENLQVIRETMFDCGSDLALAREERGVVTCAGMGATVDVMLDLIGRLASPSVKANVADILLHEHVRDLSTLQPFSGARVTDTGDEIVNRSIRIMQTHIEDPLRISDIVAELGISSRRLERRFVNALNTTPHNYYRRIRLMTAKNLVLNTNMSLCEIGMTCGFHSGFAAVFKGLFGVTPAMMRRRSHQLRSSRGFHEIA